MEKDTQTVEPNRIQHKRISILLQQVIRKYVHKVNGQNRWKRSHLWEAGERILCDYRCFD